MAQQYHSGPFVELLSTQGANPMANWKVVGLKKDSVQKVYDKVVKGNVYVITASGGVSKLQLPREEHAASLGVAQPYLVVQVCIDRGQPLLVECGVCDAGGTKRRITVTTSVSDVKVGPVHSQVPFPASVPREAWINVVVPLADLVPLLFRGCEFRWLDAVSVHLGGGKLRKVFTLRELPGDGGAEQV